MNIDDRAELRKIIDDVMIGRTNEMLGRFNVQHVQLLHIIEQTEKTNGRVTGLEDDVIILKTESSNRKYSLKSIITMSIVVSALVGAVITFFEFVIK